MNPLLAKISGILGLIFIILGVLAKNKKKEEEFQVVGGVLLFIYSYYLHDTIFMLLQAIFTITALVDLIRRSMK